MGRVFVNWPWGSIPGQVIAKTQKMALDASLLNTKHLKVWIKGKVKQNRKNRSTLPYTSMWLLFEKEPLGRLQLWSSTLIFFTRNYNCLLRVIRYLKPMI